MFNHLHSTLLKLSIEEAYVKKKQVTKQLHLINNKNWLLSTELQEEVLVIRWKNWWSRGVDGHVITHRNVNIFYSVLNDNSSQLCLFCLYNRVLNFTFLIFAAPFSGLLFKYWRVVQFSLADSGGWSEGGWHFRLPGRVWDKFQVACVAGGFVGARQQIH